MLLKCIYVKRYRISQNFFRYMLLGVKCDNFDHSEGRISLTSSMCKMIDKQVKNLFLLDNFNVQSLMKVPIAVLSNWKKVEKIQNLIKIAQ